MANEIKQPVYTMSGEKVEELSLSENIFVQKISRTLISEVVKSLKKNARLSSTHAKDRSEVRGGGRKPWRQKGTGRARHGSIRSPIWRGGGVTHGPTSKKKYSAKVNKKVKASALKMALSGKLESGEIVFVQDLNLSSPKTKELADSLKVLIKDRKGKKTLLVIGKIDENVVRASRNLPNVDVVLAQNMNVETVLAFKYLVITKEAYKVIESRLS